MQPELRGVLDRDQPLAVRDERRQDPEERGLAAARAAAHDQVGAAAHARFEETHRTRPDASLADEVLRRDTGANVRIVRTAERKGRHDRVNPAVLGSRRVHRR